MAKKSSLSRRISASKMTINHHYSWPTKIAIVVAVIGLGGAMAMWTYDLGRSFAFGPKFTPEQMTALQEQVNDVTQERDKLASFVSTIDSQQSIDKSMQKQLTDQINKLTAENIKIKEDLAFFESLMPSASRPQGITLQRVLLEQRDPKTLHYRAVVMQGGKGTHEFNGELKISLTVVQDNKTVMMEFPDLKVGDAQKIKLAFKNYQRIEGQIDLADGVVVKSGQFKVIEKDEVRAKQIVNL